MLKCMWCIISVIAIFYTSPSSAYVTTTIDARSGAVYANGALFYPIIAWNCDNLADMQEIAYHKFNVSLNMWAGYSGDANRSLIFLDNCLKANILGICGISRKLVRDLDKLSRYINKIKYHDALFAISFPDEGTTSYAELGKGNTKDEMRNAYRSIKAIAPKLLIICDHFKEDNSVSWQDLGDVVDAFGVDYYPFVMEARWNSFHNWQHLMDDVQSQTLHGNKCKALWQFAQGSSSGAYQRIPTYSDMCLQFWASITYMAKGAYQIYGWNIRENGMKYNHDIRANVYSLINNMIIPNRRWLSSSTIYDINVSLTSQCNAYLLTGNHPYISHISLIHGKNVYLIIINGHSSKTCGSVSARVVGLCDQTAIVVADSTGNDPPSVKDELVEIGDIGPFGYRVLGFSLCPSTGSS
jgi:hypothetical protein